MTLVKFGMGKAAKYVAASMTGMIYFATDTNEIYLNGTAYGVNNADMAALKAGIKSATLGDDQKTITLTHIDDSTSTLVLVEATASKAGLMSASDKAALDALNGAVTVEGSVKKQVKDAADAIKGNLVEGDAQTLKAINDEIDAIDSKFDGLDYTLAATNGKVVKSIAQDKGAVSATSDYLVATDIQIKEKTSGVAGTSLKEYELVNGNNTPLGATIVIPKDKALKSVNLVDSWYEKDGVTVPAGTEGATVKSGQGLQFTYITETGAEKVVTVDVSSFLVQSEFKNGLQVNEAGEVSVKKDAASEAFLSVSENGIKVSGIQAAIDAASGASKTTVAVATEVKEGKAQIYVESKVYDAEGQDGHTEYTVKFQDIASAATLAGLATKVSNVTGESNDTYTANSEANYIDDATSLKDADNILDTNLKALQDALTWFEADENA